MGAILKLILFFWWGGVVPSLSGLLPASFLPRERRRLHLVVMAGFLSSFALCEWIGLPILFLTPTGNYRLLLVLYLAASAVWIAAGIWRCAKTGWLQPPYLPAALAQRIRAHRAQPGGRTGAAKGKLDREELVFWGIYLALLCFQLVMAYRLASYDGDDAYYVAQSVQTWQTGTMYHYIPYTGVTTTLDRRHAMALLPMWITMIATLCRTHPTIVTHSMIPLVFLPLADLCFYSLMCAMLFDKVSRKRNRRMLPAFLILLAVLQIFGNVSIYTPESFLLLRTWQGKTVFAVMIVPCVYTVLLHLAHRLNRGEDVRGTVLAAFLVNMASGLCTSLAPILAMGLFVLGAVFVSIACRTRRAIRLLLPACIPNVIYSGILLWILLPALLS